MNALQVKVQLQPTVRQISRMTKAPALDLPPAIKRGRPPRIAQLMALAIEFQAMIDRGEVRRYSDLARLGCVSRERISQIMMLNWLAPDIQESILQKPNAQTGWLIVSEAALREIARIPSWEEQRAKMRAYGESNTQTPCSSESRRASQNVNLSDRDVLRDPPARTSRNRAGYRTY